MCSRADLIVNLAPAGDVSASASESNRLCQRKLGEPN